MSETLQQSLVQWINTFDLKSGPCQNIESLGDGVLMFQLMSTIDSFIFDLSDLNEAPGDQWPMRLANIKKLVKGLEKFYNDVLSHPAETDSLNTTAISKDRDAVEIVKLMELVLGAAVQCDHKEVYIGNIMKLSEDAQADLMMVLNKIINPDGGDGHADLSSQGNSQLVEELKSQKEELATSLAQEQKEKERVLKQLADMESERDALKTRINALEDAEKDRKLAQEREMEETKKKAEQLSANASSISAELEAQLRDKDRQVADLKKKNDELLKKVEVETKAYKDELDIARSKLEKATKLESTVAMYKQKLEEMGDLKKNLTQVESKSEQYMQQVIHLENELKQSHGLKATLDSYKDQLADEQARFKELQAQVTVKDEEIAALKEQVKGLESSKNFHEAKVTTLELEIQKLKHELELQASNSSLESSLGSSADHLSGSGDMELKEKLARLEKENALLKEQSSAADMTARIAALENELDSANRLKARLEANLKSVTQRNADLDQRLHAMLQEKSSGGGGSSSGENSVVLNSLREENARLSEALSSIQQQMKNIQQLEQEIETLRHEHKKDQSEVSRLYKEKEDLSNRLMETKEQVFKVQSTVAEKDATLIARDADIVRIQADLTTAQASERLLKQELDLLKQKATSDGSNSQELQLLKVERERDQLKYSSEVQALENKIREKELLIGTLQNELQTLKSHQSQVFELKYQEGIRTLKLQLEEKEKEVVFLKRMRDESKIASQREEALIVSTYYETGLELQRLKMQIAQLKSQLASHQQGHSWLSRERAKVSSK